MLYVKHVSSEQSMPAAVPIIPSSLVVAVVKHVSSKQSMPAAVSSIPSSLVVAVIALCSLARVGGGVVVVVFRVRAVFFFCRERARESEKREKREHHT